MKTTFISDSLLKEIWINFIPQDSQKIFDFMVSNQFSSWIQISWVQKSWGRKNKIGIYCHNPWPTWAFWSFTSSDIQTIQCLLYLHWVKYWCCLQAKCGTIGKLLQIFVSWINNIHGSKCRWSQMGKLESYRGWLDLHEPAFRSNITVNTYQLNSDKNI